MCSPLTNLFALPSTSSECTVCFIRPELLRSPLLRQVQDVRAASFAQRYSIHPEREAVEGARRREKSKVYVY